MKKFEYKNHTKSVVTFKLGLIIIFSWLLIMCQFAYSNNEMTIVPYLFYLLFFLYLIVQNILQLISVLVIEQKCSITFSETGIYGQVPVGLFTKKQIDIPYEKITYVASKNVVYTCLSNKHTTRKTPQILVYTNAEVFKICSRSKTFLYNILDYAISLPNLQEKFLLNLDEIKNIEER